MNSSQSSFRVLGANFHGSYDEVLEFQSLENRGDEILPLRQNDLLVQVIFTDVNPVDLQKLRGRDSDIGQKFENPPHVPGYGGSGKVVKVGSGIEDSNEWIGKYVCFLADPTGMGSYASFVTVDINCAAMIPLPETDEITHSDMSVIRWSASIPVAGLTAYESLAKCGMLEGTPKISNETGTVCRKKLLVVGASGGVGSWTISLVKALNPKVEVIATASSQSQHEWCKSLGADVVVRHDEIGSKLEGGRQGSVDAIVCLSEPTPDTFGTLSEVVKPYGIICLVVAGKSIGSLNLGFCFFKCVDVKTQTVFSSIRTNYENIVPSNELDVIIDLLMSNKIKAPLSPDLESGDVSESIQDAISDTGVLKSLSRTTGRRGNFVMKVDL